MVAVLLKFQIDFLFNILFVLVINKGLLVHFLHLLLFEGRLLLLSFENCSLGFGYCSFRFLYSSQHYLLSLILELVNIKMVVFWLCKQRLRRQLAFLGVNLVVPYNFFPIEPFEVFLIDIA